MTEHVEIAKIVTGDIVLDHAGNHVKVLASYRDGSGASASWCVEGYAEGLPTAHIRGNPHELIERVSRHVNRTDDEEWSRQGPL